MIAGIEMDCYARLILQMLKPDPKERIDSLGVTNWLERIQKQVNCLSYYVTARVAYRIVDLPIM